MKGFIGARQTTLASEITLTGTGVHSGAPVSITLCPADGDTGIRFLLSNGHADGTSRFVEAIDEVGLAELDAPRRCLKVLKKVSVEEAGAYGELTPHNGFR